MAVTYVNGVERRIDEQRKDVGTTEGHVLDHGALWEALLFLNRKVARLEAMVDEGDE